MDTKKRWGVALRVGLLLAGVDLGAAGSDVRLADAVMRADREAVRALLQQKIDVNAAQPDGTTALHWAVRRDDLETAQLLIRAGARVATATRYGVTPLYLASVNGNAAMIDALLRAGADPNSANPGGETALMTAARTGAVDAVKLLLDRGAAVNAKETVRGQTALMWAVLENHPAIVKLLIAQGRRHQRADQGQRPRWDDRRAAGDLRRHRRARTGDLPVARGAESVRRDDGAAVRGARRQSGDGPHPGGRQGRSGTALRQRHAPAGGGDHQQSHRAGDVPARARAPIPTRPTTSTNARRCTPRSRCAIRTTRATRRRPCRTRGTRWI